MVILMTYQQLIVVMIQFSSVIAVKIKLANVPVANQASIQLQETSNVVVKIFNNAQFAQT